MDKYYTVEEISEMLAMHPKTIQRYIREGKLRANKVGKSWRVTGHDLSVFAEKSGLTGSTRPENTQDKVCVSCVVDIMIHDKEEGSRIVNLLTAALNCKPDLYGRSTLYAQYLEHEFKVRVTLWGHLLFMREALELINVVTEQTNGEE